MMSPVDVDALLQEISGDTPCGEDLEYDPAFGELERAAQGKEEQQIGDTIVEAEEPDWRVVQKLAIDLFSRTKDIRVTLYLIRASLRTSGFIGLQSGLSLLHGLLQQYWDSIYPELDVEDNNDPTMRINALVSLCDDQLMLNPVRATQLVSSKMMGQFSLRDIAIASGQLQPTDDSGHPETATIDAAFMDADLDELQATADAISQSIDTLSGIEVFVTEQVGAANAASFAPLASVLKEARQVLLDQLARRGVNAGQEAAATDDQSQAAGTVATQTAPAISGEIRSREDVVRTLDKIRDYYAQHEPTSPLPILMERAKKLVGMNFIEIIENLAPDAMSQIETIRGPSDNQE